MTVRLFYSAQSFYVCPQKTRCALQYKRGLVKETSGTLGTGRCSFHAELDPDFLFANHRLVPRPYLGLNYGAGTALESRTYGMVSLIRLRKTCGFLREPYRSRSALRVVLAAGRNLSQEYGGKDASAAEETSKPCGSFGKICRHGFKCGSIKAEKCTKKSGYKSVCSEKEVCLKEGSKCGNSFCAYNEKCVKDENCGLSEAKYNSKDEIPAISLLDGSCFSCQPETGNRCEAVELHACVKSECEKISCANQFEKVCKKIPQKICEPVEKCETKKREECEDVPDKICKKVSKPDCDGVPKQECKPVTKDKCELKGVKECKPKEKKPAKDLPKKCKMVEKCDEYSKTVCKKDQDVENCLQVPVKGCKTVKEDPNCVEEENGAEEENEAEEEEEEEICEEVLKEVCEKIIEQECKDIVCFKTKEVEECSETTRKECKEVEFEECSGELEEKCSTQEQEECKDIPKKSCMEEKMRCRRKCIKKSSTQCKDKKGIQRGDVTCEVGVACGLKCEVTPTSTETCETIPIEACVPA